MQTYSLSTQWPQYDEPPLFTVLDLFNECANIHANKLGVGINELRKSDKTWVLSHLKMETILQPRVNESVLLKTWPSAIRRIFTFRDFLIDAANGSPLVKLKSRWVLFDLANRKALRLPSFLSDIVKDASELDISSFSSLNNDEKVNHEKSWDIRVDASHLDENQHVNNRWYVRWLFDVSQLNNDFSRTLPTHLDISYLAEAIEGDNLDCFLLESDLGLKGEIKKNGEAIFRLEAHFLTAKNLE